jgi:hypothetical protein
LTETADKKFSKDAAPLHQAIGSALSMWSQVERGLVLAFRSIAKIESYAVAEAIMSATQSFRGRMKMIDTILIVEPLPDKTLAVWKDLKKRLEKCNNERNGLAHFSIVHHSEHEPTDGFALAPLFSPAISAARGEPLLLTAAEIAEIENRFLQLGGDLQWFERPRVQST